MTNIVSIGICAYNEARRISTLLDSLLTEELPSEFVIAEIIGLDKKESTPLLTNTSFKINTLTFSSNATGIG